MGLYFFSFLVSPLSVQAETTVKTTEDFVADVEEGIEEETNVETEQELEEDKQEIEETSKDIKKEEAQELEATPVVPVEKTVDKVEEVTEEETDSVSEEQEGSDEEAGIALAAVPVTARMSYPEAIAVKYNVQIANAGYSIDTLPWGIPGHESAGKGSSKDLIGQMVQVISESPNGAYAEIEMNGSYLGWIDKKAFKGNVVRNHRTYLVNGGYSIDTLPWGTPGFKNVSNSSRHLGADVKIVMADASNSYYLAVVDGTVSGWIDSKAFSNPANNQTAMIFKSGFSVDSMPWGTPGFKTLGSTTNYLGTNVTLVQSDKHNAYALAILNGKPLGWVDKKAFSMQQTKTKQYLINPGYSIDGKPWGESWNQKIDTTNNHLNKIVYVYNVSDNGAYYFVKDANGKALGWVDRKAFSNPAEQQPAIIVRDGFSVDTRPWGEPGFKNIANIGDFYGESVTTIATSSNKAYVLVELNNGVLGWVDKKAVVINPKKQKNYILYPDYSIDNKPWGEKGYKSRGIGRTTAYLNQEVSIYAVSDNQAYYFVKDASGKPLGWVDYKALGNMNGLKRTIKKTGFSIDSRPWGEPGYTRIGKSDDHLNKVMTILGTSSNGAYSAILANGKFLGWLDNNAFQILVYLDPGHGGIPSKGGNPGAVYNGVREQDLNLTIALQTKVKLERLGYQVVMSREDGNNSYANRWEDDLYARPAHANQLGADILVSVHHNASGTWDSSMNGIETYIYGTNPNYPPLPENEDSHNNPQRVSESRKLADAIQKDLIANTGARNRGVQEGAFIVVREAKMPAVLLELGFMSNRAELNKLTTNSYQQKLVNGIVSVIHNYFLI